MRSLKELQILGGYQELSKMFFENPELYPMTTRSNTLIFFKVGVKTSSKAKNSVYKENTTE
ncbi:hypothetical protein EXN43_12550 [Clostridium botulinum]|nr:hypothetical protein [Clostridium botulinum]NFD23253.1 hypothetical protein [Clostridium botulinum]NFD26986.1 hypothetical protein [Clostridium botulinum]NFD63091.1 hypothetical protein [Clostridium botulinum]NFE05796.1 hypothetical protein [Clostridium botulinum]